MNFTMMVRFKDKCNILYTDTDSFIYNIQCEDIYKIILEDIDRFDTSDYPIDNPYGIPLTNKKTPGIMKDENCGKIMTEFVGLKSKMYATRVNGIDFAKKLKGVKKNIIKTKITFENYLDCIKKNCVISHDQNLIINCCGFGEL